MKKISLYLIIVALSLAVGWITGYFSKPSESEQIETVYVDRVQQKIIRDTVKISKPIYIKKAEDDTLTASLHDSTDYSKDTLTAPFMDTTEEVFDDDIMKERMLSTRELTVSWITSDSMEVSELLNKKASSFNEVMTVEFWQSPLNLTGYELNRNKLKLFGFNPSESISLEVKDESKELIMKTTTFEIVLTKSNQFKSIAL